MVELSEYLTFENPQTVAVLIGFAVFLIVYSLFNRILKWKIGLSLIIGLVIGVMVSWRLYLSDFYGYQGVILILAGIAAIVILYRLMRGVHRGARYSFR